MEHRIEKACTCTTKATDRMTDFSFPDFITSNIKLYIDAKSLW